MRYRACAGASLLLVLAACNQEPSFDERYAAAQKKVGATATGMDAQMRTADSAAAADQRAMEALRRERAATPSGNPPGT